MILTRQKPYKTGANALLDVLVIILVILLPIVLAYFGPYGLVREIQSRSWQTELAAITKDTSPYTVEVMTRLGDICTIPDYYHKFGNFDRAVGSIRTVRISSLGECWSSSPEGWLWIITASTGFVVFVYYVVKTKGTSYLALIRKAVARSNK